MESCKNKIILKIINKIMTKFKCKDIESALEYLRDQHNNYLFDSQIGQDIKFCAVDGVPEISSEDDNEGKEQVIDEFRTFFDNENEWLDEESSNYKQDKKDFIEIVVNRFRNNN